MFKNKVKMSKRWLSRIKMKWIKSLIVCFANKKFPKAFEILDRNGAKLKGTHFEYPFLYLLLQPGDSIPVDEATQTENVSILTTSYGGHIGFMEGLFPTRYHFSDRLFDQFASAVFQNVNTLSAL